MSFALLKFFRWNYNQRLVAYDASPDPVVVWGWGHPHCLYGACGLAQSGRAPQYFLKVGGRLCNCKQKGNIFDYTCAVLSWLRWRCRTCLRGYWSGLWLSATLDPINQPGSTSQKATASSAWTV